MALLSVVRTFVVRAFVGASQWFVDRGSWKIDMLVHVDLKLPEFPVDRRGFDAAERPWPGIAINLVHARRHEQPEKRLGLVADRDIGSDVRVSRAHLAHQHPAGEG